MLNRIAMDVPLGRLSRANEIASTQLEPQPARGVLLAQQASLISLDGVAANITPAETHSAAFKANVCDLQDFLYPEAANRKCEKSPVRKDRGKEPSWANFSKIQFSLSLLTRPGRSANTVTPEPRSVANRPHQATTRHSELFSSRTRFTNIRYATQIPNFL